MIIQKGLKSRVWGDPVDTKLSDFEYLARMLPVKLVGIQAAQGVGKSVPDDIKNALPYLLAGTANSGQPRNQSNVLNVSGVFLDIDPEDIGKKDGKKVFSQLTLEDITSGLDSVLKGYSYQYYLTTNSEPNYARVRVFVETERVMNQAELQATGQQLIDLLDLFVPIDPTCNEFGRLQGVPVDNGLNGAYMHEVHRGKPYPVTTPPKEVEKPVAKSNDVYYDTPLFTLEEAAEYMKAYVKYHEELLRQPRNKEYVSVITRLAKSVQMNMITHETAERCVEILAMGDNSWVDGNLKDLKREVKNKRLKTTYTFKDMIQISQRMANAEEDFEEHPTFTKGFTPLKELRPILKKVREIALKEIAESLIAAGSKRTPPTALSADMCKDLLADYVVYCRYDNEEGSRLAMYIPEEGIYTQNEDAIRRVISWLEPSLDERKAGTVIYHLRMASKVKARTESRYLIAVNNGVYNLKTKQLESFDPKYVFTSKIATSYIDNPPIPRISDWNVDDWLKGLADDDKETEVLLWQVIHAAMNGNYSRKKSIWLYSDGNTGKGTYQQLIMNLVGVNNVATLTVPEFSDRFSLSMLEGKVCCIGDDVPSNVYIDDSSRFNKVVTGEYLAIEQKNKPKYSGRFTMQVIQSTNGLPRIHNKTEGTYRRFLIVEFKRQFMGANDNHRIKDEYITRQDVLEYVLHKAINLDFEMFINPSVSQQLLENYKVDNDPVREFKMEVFDNFKSTRLPINFVYEAYTKFCTDNGYKALSKRSLTSNLMRILGKKWEKSKQKPGVFFSADDYSTGATEIDPNTTASCYVNNSIQSVS